MKDPQDLPPTLKPLLQALTDLDQDEEDSSSMRREAQDKLQEARDKLSQARRDLESTATDIDGPRRNPFGRKNATLKHMANELQSTPPPVLGSHGEDKSPNEEPVDE